MLKNFVVTKKQSIALRFAIGILVILILFYKIGVTEVAKILKQTNPFYVVIVFILFFASVFIGSLNLLLLIDSLKYKIPFRRLLRYHCISWATGLFVPGKIGEFSILYFLKNEKVPLGKGMSVAILDKVITFIVLAALTIVGLFLFFSIEEAKRITLIILTLVILLSLVMSSPGRNIIKRFILRKYAKKFKGFSKTMLYFLKNKKAILFLNFILTLAKWVIMAIGPYMLFFSYGHKINFTYVLLITATYVIVSLIPLSISGLGIKEAAVVVLYMRLGLPPEIILSVYIILLIIQYLIGGLFLLALPYKK